MFTLDSIISTAQAYAKAPIAFVPSKDIRTGLNEIVDAQAAFAQATTKAVTDIVTSMNKEITNFDWSKFDFSKFYAVPSAK